MVLELVIMMDAIISGKLHTFPPQICKIKYHHVFLFPGENICCASVKRGEPTGKRDYI